MLTIAQQLAKAIAGSAASAGGFIAAAAPAARRRRSISEILDVERTFVGGYPQAGGAPDEAAEVAANMAR